MGIGHKEDQEWARLSRNGMAGYAYAETARWPWNPNKANTLLEHDNIRIEMFQI